MDSLWGINLSVEHSAAKVANPSIYAHAEKLYKLLTPDVKGGRQMMREPEIVVYESLVRRDVFFEPKRMYGVFAMPYMSVEELRNHYPFEGTIISFENMWMLPLVSSKVGSFAVEFEGTQYLMAELNKSSWSSSSLSSIERIKLLQFGRPALVKNALVVMRTLAPVLELDYSVLVKGSRAMHAGGQWAQEVAIYALRKAKSVRFDLYDPHEEPSVSTVEYNGGKATIRRIRGKYTGDGHEFTVSIDDAWASDEVTGDRAPRSKYFSIKKPVSLGVDPFYHDREGRVYSHEATDSSQSPCRCELCELIHSFSNSSDAMLIRRLMTTLGAHTCAQDVWADDLRVRDILLTIRSGAVDRQRIPDRIVRLVAMHQPIAITATRVAQGTLCEKRVNTGYLRNREVVFVGIPPSVLGDEPYITVKAKMSYDRHENVVLITDHMSGVHSTIAREVWSPVEIPGFRSTGRSIGDFREQLRIHIGGNADTTAIFVYEGDGKEYDPGKVKNLKGIFKVSKAVDPKQVSGPGGKNSRKVTLFSGKIYVGGGYNVVLGLYGSYPPDYSRPVACSKCRQAGEFKCNQHLYYTSTGIYPTEWSHIAK